MRSDSPISQAITRGWQGTCETPDLQLYDWFIRHGISPWRLAWTPEKILMNRMSSEVNLHSNYLSAICIHNTLNDKPVEVGFTLQPQLQ